MKKLLYLFLLLPFAMLTSCNKEDLAPFAMTLTLSNVSGVDGSFYAVAGTNITIESLTVDPIGGKNTALQGVMFYLDGRPMLGAPWFATAPWVFSTEGLAPGQHTIGIAGNLLQIDQSIQEFTASYSLVIVDSTESLPEGAPELGTSSQTIVYNN